jgi:hypothetical protein
MGNQTALPLSGVLLSCLIFLTTYLLFPWLGISKGQSWAAGIIWLCMTVLFEFGFGHFVMGKSWEVLLQAYDVSSGNLWTVVLLVILLSPRLVWKVRNISS